MNPVDVEEIASAIIRLLTNEDYARRLGLQGMKRIESQFNWRKIISEMRRELNRLI